MGIKLEKLNVSFDGFKVLEDFTLELPKAGSVSLSGPSGCGKTTLLFVLAGLQLTQSGLIHGLKGQRISMLFQEDRLLPWLSVAENVALVLAKGHSAEALPWLELVELTAEAQALPQELSGGMRRRVALARALAYDADILLLDEPTNGLDNDLACRIMERIKERYAGRLILMATHDLMLAARQTLRIELSGPPLQVASGR